MSRVGTAGKIVMVVVAAGIAHWNYWMFFREHDD
jgi:hypothetical protein